VNLPQEIEAFKPVFSFPAALSGKKTRLKARVKRLDEQRKRMKPAKERGELTGLWQEWGKVESKIDKVLS
jgi:hypothetical protein